jgi:serine/threonine-protein kinase HipA
MLKLKRLNIRTAQGFAGELARESQFVFNYRTDDPRCEIALTMPLRAQSYTANLLPGVLRQNLPEGYLLDWIKEHLAKVAKMDDMTILAISGREVIGRVQACREDDDGSPRYPGENLKTLLTWKGTEDLFHHLAEQYAMASGISGVQPKVVVPIRVNSGKDVIEKVSVKDRGLIVKSSGEDYPGLAENEFYCMSIARDAKLIVPPFWLSEDKKLFVVERFDIGERGYLGFEDMTSLMNRQNSEKYNGSYENVAKAVALFTSPAHVTPSLHELFAAITLSVLLRNGDAHLKNFGLLYSDPRSDDCRLSPLYDIVNTTVYLPKDILALKLNGSKSWPLARELAEFGKRHCRVDHPNHVIDRIATAATEYRPPEDSAIWQNMKPLIDHACYGLATGKR